MYHRAIMTLIVLLSAITAGGCSLGRRVTGRNPMPMGGFAEHASASLPSRQVEPVVRLPLTDEQRQRHTLVSFTQRAQPVRDCGTSCSSGFG